VIELLNALATFTRRYPFNKDIFTAVHTTFIQACVKLRRYEVALPVLNIPMAQIDKNIYPVTYLDNLLYHYLGAFIYISLRRWTEAEEYLEMVVSAPIASNAPSAIQMEAMKKLSLVQLIIYGQLKNMPKYVPALFTKNVKQSAYGQLAKIYPGGPLIQLIEKEAKTFLQDFNMGLVKEALSTAPRWKLKTLTKTYLTLSLSEIGKEIGIADLAALRGLVENMVSFEGIDIGYI
jgi:COP9 signalosome complex subunit 3